MKIYLYSQTAKFIAHWSTLLENYKILNESNLNSVEGILIVDYASYEKVNLLKNFKLVVLDMQPTFQKCIALMQEDIKAYGNVYMHQSHLLSAIQSIEDGKVWMYPDFIANLIASSEKAPTNNVEEKLSLLTTRESEIAKLICDGLTNKEIAIKLDITTNTIKNHTKHIYNKLNVNDRLSLFAYLK